MRFPVIVSCACFLVSFGFARWATPRARSISPGETAIPDLRLKKPISPPSEISPEARPTHDSARQRLAKAFESGDPLASAVEAVDWLDTATVEDFQKLAENPETFPWPRFSGLNMDFRIALYEAVAERWLDLDPKGGLSGLLKLQKAMPMINYSGPDELLTAAARVRPEIVLEGLPLMDEGGSVQYPASAALVALARRNPRAAREFLDRFTTPEAHRQAETAIARGIIATNPLQAVSLVQQLGDESLYPVALYAAERIGPDMIRQLVSAAGGKLDNHPDIPKLLLRYPDLAADLTSAVKPEPLPNIPNDLLRSADRLDPTQRQQWIERYDTMPEGARETAAAAIASAWARTEPEKAAEWAVAHAKLDDRSNPANRAADAVFLRWVNNDPNAALAWWRNLPPSPLRDALGTNASTFIAENGLLDEAMEMFQPQPGKADEFITAQMSQYLVEHDPSQAAAWIKALPSEVSVERATDFLVSEWYPKDPESLARWVESLPPGMRRDHALSSFVTKAAQHNPEGAAEWVETVADPKLRQDAALQVYWAMLRSNPAAAGKWLRSLTGVDPDWHARFLRRFVR